MDNNGLLETMAGITGGNMVYHVSFGCIITGCNFSAPFLSGDIVPNETVLYPFRERSRSTLARRSFRVRQGDDDAVVLKLQDRHPSFSHSSRREREDNHGGYLGYDTGARDALIEMMEHHDVCPYIKVMVVYSDTDLSETIVAGGRTTNYCNGKIYVFIRQDKLDDVGPAVADILSDNGVATE